MFFATQARIAGGYSAVDLPMSPAPSLWEYLTAPWVDAWRCCSFEAVAASVAIVGMASSLFLLFLRLRAGHVKYAKALRAYRQRGKPYKLENVAMTVRPTEESGADRDWMRGLDASEIAIQLLGFPRASADAELERLRRDLPNLCVKVEAALLRMRTSIAGHGKALASERVIPFQVVTPDIAIAAKAPVFNTSMLPGRLAVVREDSIVERLAPSERVQPMDAYQEACRQAKSGKHLDPFLVGWRDGVTKILSLVELTEAEQLSLERQGASGSCVVLLGSPPEDICAQAHREVREEAERNGFDVEDIDPHKMPLIPQRRFSQGAAEQEAALRVQADAYYEQRVQEPAFSDKLLCNTLATAAEQAGSGYAVCEGQFSLGKLCAEEWVKLEPFFRLEKLHVIAEKLLADFRKDCTDLVMNRAAAKALGHGKDETVVPSRRPGGAQALTETICTVL